MDSTLSVLTRDEHSQDTFAHLPDGIILADGESRVTYLNPAAEQLLGNSLGKVRGRLLDKVLTLHDREARLPIKLSDMSKSQAAFMGAFHLLLRNGGGLVPVQYSVTQTRTDSGMTSGYIVSLRNASDLQHYIDRLMTQTMHDEHSRLLRRAELIKRMWRLLQDTDSGEPQAFMYLDLDNFKSVNDTAGHAAGDLAIRQIAGRLKDVVRGRDSLARLGGDEFGLLLEGCPAEHARLRAMQLHQAVESYVLRWFADSGHPARKPTLHQAVESYVLRWDGETFRLGISIGIALFNTHRHSLNAILAAADAACYKAKRNTDNAIHIQEVSLD